MKSSTAFAPLFLAVLGLTLASCAGKSVFREDIQVQDYRDQYPVQVTPHMASLRLPYEGPGAGLDPNMTAQFRTFVRDYLDRGNGAISVSAPEGWESAALEFAGEIATLGVPRDRILIGTDIAPRAGGEIVVSYITYVAESSPCGDWTRNVAFTLNNESLPNLGCATQNNIAAMVADPRDLIAPQPAAQPDVDRSLVILERYRQGEPTQAEQPEDQTTTISVVGAN